MRNISTKIIYVYANGIEKTFEIHSKYSNNEKIPIDNKDVGTCFCSLLNSKDKVIALKNEFIKTYISKYSSKVELINIKEIIDSTYNKLVDINKYFIILSNKFNKLSKESQMTTRLDKLEIIYNNYMQDIVKLLDSIISTITSFENISSNRLSFNEIKIPYCYMTSISEDNKSYKYTYTLYTLDDLLAVSFYILSNDKYYLKQCKYPNCNKFFVTKTKQSRFCTNPCPADPSKTCKTIRKKANYNLKVSYWEDELVALDKQVNSIRQFFNYYIKKSNNQREIKMLQTNKENFTDTIQTLKKYIKGCTDNDRINIYLKICKDFVIEVKSNQKLPKPIFKVKKPKYKNL